MSAGLLADGDDGSELLTTAAVDPLLRAAVGHAGGELESWRLDHVDANPGRSTTATYLATVSWPYGTRSELLGVSARSTGPVAGDARARIFADGDRRVAVWLYPDDPDLPGLARAASRDRMAELITELRLVGRPVSPSQLRLHMIGYRPRRRAVLRVELNDPVRAFYVKVLRERVFDEVCSRHRMLLDAGVPAPRVLATTKDHLLILAELPGRPLARALFDRVDPCTAEDLIGLLDTMPAEVAGLRRRPPWSEAIEHFAQMVATAMPSQAPRLEWMSTLIQESLAGVPEGDEPTHGDFHEGQVHVAGGRVCGVLDVDTIGPGRRADDLACLVAHLSTVQRMDQRQAARVHHLIRRWVPVFDQRVDPTELRLRAAAVIISLATGPYRGQEPHWEHETVSVLDAAEALVRQVA
ncbi:MAG: aminoglycoside phosphotransferase family protein [Acidipropionibacterium sp.]|jgi:hypothetical protein|nr:aminoglycoside phosphotransferase family protein [Acidipropionibacterium sp.]